MTRKLFRRAALIGLLAAVAPAALSASSALAAAQTPITDCQAHGRLTQSYTVAELQHALATLPADVKQYTDCQDVITRALDAALKNPASGSASSGRSGGSFLPTWLIIVIVLLVLAGATVGAIAIRRRRQSP